MSKPGQETSESLRLDRPTGDTYDSTSTVTPTLPSVIFPAPEEDELPDLDQSVELEGLDDTAIQELIELIKTVATSITEVLDLTHSEQLQEQITEWCERHGFDPTEDYTFVIIARQAVLNLLLKATLYECYCRRGTLPSLSGDYRSAFKHAETKSGKSVFGETVLDDIVWLAEPEDLDSVIDARYDLLESADPPRDIGSMYRELVPTTHRKMLSQFWTPQIHRRLLRQWASIGQSRVLDPGLGAGRLSSQYHPSWSVSSDPDYVHGIDRSPLALLMGSTALELSGQDHDPIEADFLALSPDLLSTDVDTIICNPPFTRSADMQPAYKDRINRQIQRDLDVNLPKSAPLYSYFLCHARQFLSAGDRAAFITPADYLSTKYGEPLKQFLRSEYDIKAFVLFSDPAEEVRFTDVQSTILLTFLEARDNGDTPGLTRFIEVDETPDLRVLQSAINDGSPGVTDWGSIYCVPQTELDSTRNWQACFGYCNRTNGVTYDEDDIRELPQLGDFVDVMRGPVTGAVEFFCLSQAEVTDIGLDETYLSPLIRSSKYIDGYDFRPGDWERLRMNGKSVWLLDPDELPIPRSIDEIDKPGSGEPIIPRDEITTLSEDLANLLSYLEYGVTEYEFHDSNIIANDQGSKRPFWYRPRRRQSTRVLVPYSTRDRFKFILNESDVRHYNTMLGFYDVTLSDTELKALLAYLNSTVFDAVAPEYYKTRDGGLKQTSPNKLEQVPVIDPTELPTDTLSALAASFDALCDTTRRDGESGRVIEDINEILQQDCI